MRQQYHFMQTESGVFVWNVDKLIQLAKEFPVIEIPLSQIAELDEPYWSHGKVSLSAREIALHAKLIQESDLQYPILLHAGGRVMDGMHRCCKALLLGHQTIKAVQFKQMPAPDYVDPDPHRLPYDDDFSEVLARFGLEN